MTCVECEANGRNCTAHGGRPGIPYTPENVECSTCDGLGQVRDYCSFADCSDPHCSLVSLHCPDCTPDNVEER